MPLRFTPTLDLEFSSTPCGGHLWLIHPSTEHPSTLLREGNVLEEKEKKQLVQSQGEFGPDSFLGASGQGPAFLGLQEGEQGVGILGW